MKRGTYVYTYSCREQTKEGEKVLIKQNKALNKCSKIALQKKIGLELHCFLSCAPSKLPKSCSVNVSSKISAAISFFVKKKI